MEQHRTLPSSIRPHIGVVGAGVAGLRCADLLLQRGFRVTIIEGRDRVGGRMHQIELPNTNYLVDLGPNWIHGTDHNPILDLAKETDTLTHAWGDNINLFDEDGEPLPAEDAKHLNEVMWGIVVDAFTYSNKHTSLIPADQSLYDWFLMQLDQAIPDTVADYERKRKLVLRISEMWGAFVGSTVQKQSLKFFWLEECIEGGM
jgi:Flavin containing amine oxidoreductase